MDRAIGHGGLFGLVLLLAAPPSGQGQAPVTLSLERAITLALEENWDVQAARLELERAEGEITEAKAGAFPELRASLDYQRNIELPALFFEQEGRVTPTRIGADNNYQGGATLTQTLFDRGKIGTGALSIARIFADMTEWESQATEAEVVLRVKEAYYDVLLAERLVAVNREAHGQAELQLGQVQQFYRQGTAAEFDLLRARVEVENRRAALTESETTLDLATDRLKNVLGLPLSREVFLSDSLEIRSGEGGITDPRTFAPLQRPEVRAAQLRERLAEEQVGLFKGDRLPTVSLISSYQRIGQTNDAFPSDREFIEFFNVGIQVDIPIFDGFKTKGQIQQAEAQYKQARVRLEQLKARIGLEVRAAQLALRSARQDLAAQKAAVEEARRAAQLAQVRFRNGLSTQLEVNDAQLALTEARTNLARTMYRLNVAQARFERALGLSSEGVGE